MFRRVKLGLALGAGGARGLAHIGVLRALERAGVRISFVAGSSIGALVGAAYALTGHAAELEHLVLDFIATPQYQESGLTTITEAFSQKPGPWPQRIETWIKRVYLQAKFVTAPSVLDSDTYKGIIDFFLPDILMEDLPIPFRALGTDIRTGRPVVFKTGSLRSAVYASCAIPGLVLPLEYQDHLVVDGGVLNMVPVGSARAMGAEAVIGVDVEKDVDFKENAKSAFDQLFHIEEIQSCYLKKLQIRTADLVLKPDVGHIHWSDFSQAQELFRLGKDAVIQDLDRIQDLTRRRRYPWRRFRSSESCPDWMEF